MASTHSRVKTMSAWLKAWLGSALGTPIVLLSLSLSEAGLAAGCRWPYAVVYLSHAWIVTEKCIQGPR